MADIHGLIYFILGLVIAVVSFIVNQALGQSRLLVFVYIGIGMVGIGIGKLIFQGIRKKRTKGGIAPPQAPPAGELRKAGTQASAYYRKFCHKCGSAVHHTASFCHVCGQRLLGQK